MREVQLIWIVGWRCALCGAIVECLAFILVLQQNSHLNGLFSLRPNSQQHITARMCLLLLKLFLLYSSMLFHFGNCFWFTPAITCNTNINFNMRLHSTHSVVVVVQITHSNITIAASARVCIINRSVLFPHSRASVSIRFAIQWTNIHNMYYIYIYLPHVYIEIYLVYFPCEHSLALSLSISRIHT